MAYYGKKRNMTYREIITHYLTSVERWSRTNGVPMPVVFAIIKQESDGNFLALGPTGDYGLMQITQPALTDFNVRTGKKYTLDYIRHNADANIEVGSSHLSVAFKHFKGDVFLAVRAYNVGVGAASKDNTAGFGYAKSVFTHKQQFEKELLA